MILFNICKSSKKERKAKNIRIIIKKEEGIIERNLNKKMEAYFPAMIEDVTHEDVIHEDVRHEDVRHNIFIVNSSRLVGTKQNYSSGNE